VVVEVVDGEFDELATRPIATAATTTTTVSAIHHLLLRRMIHSPVAYIGTQRTLRVTEIFPT
jgi:hypothetical protein